MKLIEFSSVLLGKIDRKDAIRVPQTKAACITLPVVSAENSPTTTFLVLAHGLSRVLVFACRGLLYHIALRELSETISKVCPASTSWHLHVFSASACPARAVM